MVSVSSVSVYNMNTPRSSFLIALALCVFLKEDGLVCLTLCC